MQVFRLGAVILLLGTACRDLSDIRGDASVEDSQEQVYEAGMSDSSDSDRFNTGDGGRSDAGPKFGLVVTEVSADTFAAGGTSTITIEVQDVNRQRVGTDNATQVAFSPTLGGTIQAVSLGEGDGSYGLVGGVERVIVSGGQARIVVTDLVAETFDIWIWGSAAYESAPAVTIRVTPSPVLHAWWKLDETNGATAFDSSGYGRAATIIGASSRTSGIDGRAVSLSPSNYLMASGLLGTPTSITISAWTNLSTPDTLGSEILSLGNCVVLRQDANAGLIGLYWDGVEEKKTQFGGRYAGRGWHHFAYSADPTRKVQRIYVDGELVSFSRFAEAIFWTGCGSNTFIGRHSDNTQHDVTGSIDDVRVYGRALSDVEVRGIYLQFSGLMGHWPLDDGANNVARDVSPRGRPLRLVSGARWATLGPRGTSMSLEGVGQSAGETGYAFEPLRNITILGWGNLTRASTLGSMLVVYRNAVELGLDHPDRGVSGEFSVGGGPQSRTTSNINVALTGWHHFAYAIDDDKDTAALFIDGAPSANSSIVDQSIAYDPTQKALWIGRLNDSEQFVGNIADVRIYNRALSESEISRIRAQASGLVAWWKFDETEGSVAADSAGHRIDGAVVRSEPGWTSSGTIAGALRFDGGGSYVEIPQFALAEMTFACWVQVNSGPLGSSQDWIYWDRRGGALDVQDQEGVGVYLDPGNPPRLVWLVTSETSAGTRNTDWVQFGGLSNSLDRWIHVAATYERATGLQKLYVNGAIVDSTQHLSGNAIVPRDSRNDIRIGGSGTSGASLDGLLDDVRVYDRALSQTEIQALFQRRSAP